MKLKIAVREVHPRRPFQIARPRRDPPRNVFVRLEAGGLHGYGEASPSSFYAESVEGVVEHLQAATELLSDVAVDSPEDIARIWEQIWPLVAPSRAAQCAIDIALWDWLAKRCKASVAELAWGQPAHPIATFCTIGLCDSSELDERIFELHGFPRIKIKSDQSAQLDNVRRVRDRSSATIAIDANCAWIPTDLAALSAELARLEVAFIEQPLRACDDLRIPRCCLPVFADESCVVETDVARVAQSFSGFNVKLVKCGGITPALRMVRQGRELGLKTMVGCMLESSALIAAGAAVAQGADFADLDGAWLLRDDPMRGWSFAHGYLLPPKHEGLGVEPHAQLFAE